MLYWPLVQSRLHCTISITCHARESDAKENWLLFYRILNFRGQVEQGFPSFANCLDIFDGFQSEARQNFEKPEMMPPTKQFGKK